MSVFIESGAHLCSLDNNSIHFMVLDCSKELLPV